MSNHTIPQLDAAEIRRQVDLLELVKRDTCLKKVAATGGGEYGGACPFCGGHDRFRVQLVAPPGKKPEGQRWMCRQCSPRWQDVLGYVMKRDNCDFVEAMKKLAGASTLTAAHVATNQPSQAPATSTDRIAWTDSAYSFVEECEDKLWSSEGAAALKYLHWRGLQDDTLNYWRIGYNPTEGFGKPEEWGLASEEKIFIPKGIVIPCEDKVGLHYVKVRRRDGEPKYLVLKGGQMWPYGLQTYLNAMTAFLFEGEFDALLAWQTGLGVGFASLPAGQELKPDYGSFFELVEDVIVAYDNDGPGEKAADKLCRLEGFHRAQELPAGKDLTEYHLSGGDVFEWIYQQLGAI